MPVIGKSAEKVGFSMVKDLITTVTHKQAEKQ